MTYYQCKEVGHKSFQCSKNPIAASSISSLVKPVVPGASQKNRIYVMMQVEAYFHPNVITSIFLVNNITAYVLFDTRATVSFVASSLQHV